MRRCDTKKAKGRCYPAAIIIFICLLPEICYGWHCDISSSITKHLTLSQSSFRRGWLASPTRCVQLRYDHLSTGRHYRAADRSIRGKPAKSPQLPTRLSMLISSSSAIENNQALALWIISFASSHIGLSAIRTPLISTCGQIARATNLTNRKIKLPSYWPGDDVNKNELFPDADTAGRQIYRAGYTIISFLTLGGALSCYLGTNADTALELSKMQRLLCNGAAAASFGVSIASLVNASPLSLMPGFESSVTDDDGNDEASILGLSRNDSLKFTPMGLTRITRHPLIIPVLPWGLATSFLAGGRPCDFILFGGLGLYAVAGCAAQDLRVVREEGSVGTVFRDEGNELQRFFAKTSFVPFGAVIDGRQNMGDVLREFPWLVFGGGCIVGGVIEDLLLRWLLGVGVVVG